MLGIPDGDHGMHLLDQLLLLVVIELHVPLGQACLACPVLDEDESDLEQAGWEMRDSGNMAQGRHHETFYGRDVGAQALPVASSLRLPPSLEPCCVTLDMCCDPTSTE